MKKFILMIAIAAMATLSINATTPATTEANPAVQQEAPQTVDANASAENNDSNESNASTEAVPPQS